ncbi:hypothetical protein GGR56DRAFT_148575 [Xylariaceae sp. FL0804]|nr:hypothetical protein GGR56DRAFT_148575 [Xylariaceae sp. FL0804]
MIGEEEESPRAAAERCYYLPFTYKTCHRRVDISSAVRIRPARGPAIIIATMDRDREQRPSRLRFYQRCPVLSVPGAVLLAVLIVLIFYFIAFEKPKPTTTTTAAAVDIRQSKAPAARLDNCDPSRILASDATTLKQIRRFCAVHEQLVTVAVEEKTKKTVVRSSPPFSLDANASTTSLYDYFLPEQQADNLGHPMEDRVQEWLHQWAEHQRTSDDHRHYGLDHDTDTVVNLIILERFVHLHLRHMRSGATAAPLHGQHVATLRLGAALVQAAAILVERNDRAVYDQWLMPAIYDARQCRLLRLKWRKQEAEVNRQESSGWAQTITEWVRGGRGRGHRHRDGIEGEYEGHEGHEDHDSEQRLEAFGLCFGDAQTTMDGGWHDVCRRADATPPQCLLAKH